ncbi:MAG: PIN domain-containing protein [Candidatus Magasanikbacteria bacterium]|nr:PIN domain-containing protein [Candidatus Magasanikbacteria bacterium]
MIILDSSVWVAYMNELDNQHAAAAKVMTEVILPVVVPEYIMVETCTVLTAKANKELAVFFLNFISDNNNCDILFSNEVWARRVINFFKTEAPATLSFPDTALLYLARDYTVITFDKQLARAIKKLATK